MHKFKVGDRVKQIFNVSSDENPYVIITKILLGDEIEHRHEGNNFTNVAYKNDFEELTIKKEDEVFYA